MFWWMFDIFIKGKMWKIILNLKGEDLASFRGGRGMREKNHFFRQKPIHEKHVFIRMQKERNAMFERFKISWTCKWN